MAAATLPSRNDLSGDVRRHRRERVYHGLFLAAAASSVVISVAILVALGRGAFEFVTNIEVSSLWTDGWFPRRGLYDLKTLFMGTLLTSAVAMCIAAPAGLATAVYLAEYASDGLRRVLKPTLEVLASIPSVVIGFFALTWISPNVVQLLNPASPRFSLAAAGLGVGLLVTPLVASVSEDALRAVPSSLREAAYGLGSRKVQNSLRVVIPAAVSGIVASMILAVSRAIGETMVVALAAGGSDRALFTTNVFAPGSTMTAAMMSLATGSDQVATTGGAGAGQAFNSLYFLGFALFLVTLLLNVFGNLVVRRVRNRY